jgi:hypothetical protein
MLARLKVIRSIVFGEPNTQAKTHIAKNNGVLALNVSRKRRVKENIRWQRNQLLVI